MCYWQHKVEATCLLIEQRWHVYFAYLKTRLVGWRELTKTNILFICLFVCVCVCVCVCVVVIVVVGGGFSFAFLFVFQKILGYVVVQFNQTSLPDSSAKRYLPIFSFFSFFFFSFFSKYHLVDWIPLTVNYLPAISHLKFISFPSLKDLIPIQTAGVVVVEMGQS